MTKQSANPRRYSRGETLDPNQPISVYMALKITQDDFSNTVERIDYLSEQYPVACLSFAGYHKEDGDIVLTLEINVGPARLALRGLSPELDAGHGFLWDTVKTLFYANPVFCSPPHQNERESIKKISHLLPTLKKTNEKAKDAIVSN